MNNSVLAVSPKLLGHLCTWISNFRALMLEEQPKFGPETKNLMNKAMAAMKISEQDIRLVIQSIRKENEKTEV